MNCDCAACRLRLVVKQRPKAGTAAEWRRAVGSKR